jgi:cytidylate kinase
VAQRVGLAHLDTGSYYRAATLAVLRADVAPAESEPATEVVQRAAIEPVDGVMTLDGETVEDAIRGGAVTAAVSEVSAIPAVRDAMVEAQRTWVADRGGEAVVEGRDIGTVVFPDADIKVYLTASEEERARRRAVERDEDLRFHLAAIRRRDEFDSTRESSPLRPADDAIVLDTTGMSVDEVVDEIVRLIEDARG